MLTTLVIVLIALVICIGLAGIVVTHRVAGPIYKMTRQIKDVTGGDFTVPASLRKGDELVGFFEAFREMVQSLRDRRKKEIGDLEVAMEKLEPTSAPRELGPLRELRDRMRRPLGG
jgi:nitrogen fixation/metabolism regulation signal transduction histidine kinase